MTNRIESFTLKTEILLFAMTGGLIMCTSIAMFQTNAVFGRNLDLEQHFSEAVVITPQNYPFHFQKTDSISSHFAMIGMASVVQDVPLYAEAMNEKGLYMAGLNFPHNACYAKRPWLLMS